LKAIDRHHIPFFTYVHCVFASFISTWPIPIDQSPISAIVSDVSSVVECRRRVEVSREEMQWKHVKLGTAFWTF